MLFLSKMRKLGVNLYGILIIAVLAGVLLLTPGCALKRMFRTTYYVPEDKYLLKDNEVTIVGDEMNEDEVKKVIRQQANTHPNKLKIKFRLMAYNAIRPEKAENDRLKRLRRLKEKNAKRLIKEERINIQRREKAIQKGDTVYFYKSFKLKDTLSPRLTIRERIKYKMGEPPVVSDTFLYKKSQEQLSIYMHKRGYYFDSISSVLDTVNRKKRKVVARYTIHTGPRFYIDSFYVVSGNADVAWSFRKKFLKKIDDKYGFNQQFYAFQEKGTPLHVPFDEDKLGDYRTIIAKFMRDETYYGFSPSHIKYYADTNYSDMTVKLAIMFGDRVVKSPIYKDSLITVPHVTTRVRSVYFHICDTTLYEGNFVEAAHEKMMDLLDKNKLLNTLDTFYYDVQLRKAENQNDGDGKKKTYFKSAIEKGIFGNPKDSIQKNPFRMATFVYNGEMFVDPGLLEAQNYLEYTNYYKEYYFDRTYNRLLQLGLFSVIKPEIVEIPGTGEIEVHYYLVPAKKQTYGFEPRATNSNGFLGVSASLNYSNNNLFRSGWLTTVSLSGGFESQPPVFDETEDGQKIQKAGRSFNTFEIGPSIKFDLPGFFPVNVAKLAKRSRPRTVLSAAYNYQHRPDFTRSVFQMNYLWKLYVGKTQIVSAGLPFLSVIKYVTLNKSSEFEERIILLNDLFLRNAYSNQLIWEDFKLMYDYDNREYESKISEKLRVTFNVTLSTAGNTLSLAKNYQESDSVGHKQSFGVTYSQFAIIDTKYIAYYSISKKHTVALRAMAGVGKPYGNTTTSLPYDYSFFAGGSNDIRGFVARSLGPGAYKYYMDSNRTATQIGDIRMGGSIEWRLGTGFLQSAFFADAGNIWTFNDDVNRPGGKFSNSWYKEIAMSVGYGVRVDFDFFVVRFDLGIPLTNPALPSGSRWIFQSRAPYLAEIATLTQEQRDKLYGPFKPRLNIGIGFPF